MVLSRASFDDEVLALNVAAACQPVEDWCCLPVVVRQGQTGSEQSDAITAASVLRLCAEARKGCPADRGQKFAPSHGSPHREETRLSQKGVSGLSGSRAAVRHGHC